MNEKASSKYWLMQTAAAIKEHCPDGELVLSSGHSPSGRYHMGLLREFVTVDALVRALRQNGREAKHLDFVDDFDRLRKVPAGVPESFEQYLGMPLYLAPDPLGQCHKSYADHYFSELLVAIERAGIKPKVIRSHQQYQKGTFTGAIEASLEKLELVKTIIKDVGGRELDDDWAPVQLLSDNHRLNEWQFAGWDKGRQVVYWRAAGGKEGELDYTRGRVKLDWRLDWPARWSIWRVAAEPFGRDHASAGGSYYTGRELVEQIYGSEAPFPVPYDFINIVGQTKKMSKSAGDVITPGDVLEIVPAEILRYFVLRSRPNKLLVFDPGLGLYNLIDEYSQVEAAKRRGESHEFSEAYQAANVAGHELTISSVPFSHLVAVYQAALGDFDQILAILARTGYEGAVGAEHDVLRREVSYVSNWLREYAPESVKFAVQEKLPDVKLSAEEKDFLGKLASHIERESNLSGQAMHDLIYTLKDQLNIKPSQAFTVLYRVILGKDSGPKAGWFLASLDQAWLVKRLKEATK